MDDVSQPARAECWTSDKDYVWGGGAAADVTPRGGRGPEQLCKAGRRFSLQFWELDPLGFKLHITLSKQHSCVPVHIVVILETMASW